MKGNQDLVGRVSALVLCAAGFLAGSSAFPADGDSYGGKTINTFGHAAFLPPEHVRELLERYAR